MKAVKGVASLILAASLSLHTQVQAQDAPSHSQIPFWDRQQVAGQVFNVAMHAADAYQSCHTSGREVMGPWQSCGGITAWTLGGGTVVGVGASYLLHKSGHNRLAHILPWALGTTSGFAIAYTQTKRRR